ncbi:Uncharacterised protein [Neisseria meningitidis]|nr:Uncharacterised protein [Neisseria meningitidis]CWR82339.1 Uncharacterised protein [Neisseria meningitidis]
MVLPKTLNSPHTPKDSADGMPIMKMAVPISQVCFLRLRSSWRMVEAMTVSNIENAEVSVAKTTSSINTANKTVPNGIFINTAGNTIKINPGPWLGSKPKANTAGKITRPASSETKRFIHIIVWPERNIS